MITRTGIRFERFAAIGETKKVRSVVGRKRTPASNGE